MNNHRIYVCHTFYHIYVTLLKEFHMPDEEKGKADIVLSNISSDLFPLAKRLEESGVFGHVYKMEEKKESFFPELAKYRKSYNNIVRHLVNRIIFTKKLARLEEPFVPVDFRAYKDVYVYCDSDPIGYYLNYKHIYYHALEDGLDCLKYLDAAYYDNRGHFKLKAWLSARNIIFIQNGYGKYCLDMEVNDLSCLRRSASNYKVVPRKPLESGLTKEQKMTMLRVFMEDADEFMKDLVEKAAGRECILFLTMPHPQDEEIRKRICKDILRDHCQGYHTVIKPHPRDLIDYAALCPECTVIKGKFPIEVMNFMEGIKFKRALSIATTAIDTLDFCEEKVNLGESFWDAYEDPALHNWQKI
ncbi:MAG: lipooligosaccharide sialyltransferase [Lachnospiraceae bacterium]|nr:lipooligosaccharide sialyltransferase [Lachnospiraceae bacterium]